MIEPTGPGLSITTPRDYDLDDSGAPVANPVRVITTYGYDKLYRRDKIGVGGGLVGVGGDDLAGVGGVPGLLPTYRYGLMSKLKWSGSGLAQRPALAPQLGEGAWPPLPRAEAEPLR